MFISITLYLIEIDINIMLNFKSEKFLQLACVSIDPAYHFYLHKYIAWVWTFFFSFHKRRELSAHCIQDSLFVVVFIFALCSYLNTKRKIMCVSSLG